MTVFTGFVGQVAPKLLISVCIVTFNQERYIRDAVMSVMAQVNPAEFDVEILVGDDCSTDSTPIILRDLAILHPEFIKVVTHSQNVGGCENYLMLLRQARGNFIAHLDGDDYWLPGKLSEQLAFLDKHQECEAVYTNAVVVDAGGVLLGGFSNNQPEIFPFSYIMERGNFLNHSSLLYRGCALERLSKIESPFVDYMIHLTLAKQSNLGLLPAAYVVYRSMTNTSMLKNQFSHFDDLYLKTIIMMAAEAPESVRNSCCATYIVNTLGAHPSWCKKRDFWLRATSLARKLKLKPFTLFVGMARVLFSGMRKILAMRVSRLLYGSNTLVIVHPRH